MPARSRRNKRRRSPHISAEAVALFRQGFDLLRGPYDPYELHDIKILLAAALGRSKFRASPLDRQPRSLIGCDPCLSKTCSNYGRNCSAWWVGDQPFFCRNSSTSFAFAKWRIQSGDGYC